VGFGVGFMVSAGESADIQFYGLQLQDIPARNLVIIGIITGLIAALGAESVRWGTARWRRRRRLARKRERELSGGHDSAVTDATVTPAFGEGEQQPDTEKSPETAEVEKAVPISPVGVTLREEPAQDEGRKGSDEA
ncbi:MAG: hypothetical protein ACRDQZ_19060, partial [Mycobacteriales bacterium]